MADYDVGELVIISGNIRRTQEVVHVTNTMKNIINNNKKYSIQELKYGGRKQARIIKVNGWWWSPLNIQKVIVGPIKIKNLKPSTFKVELLDV